MESFLKSASLFVDDDQCIDYLFGFAQEAPLSPDSWTVTPGMPDHSFDTLVNLEDFTPPATEPASPIRGSFPHGKSMSVMPDPSAFLDLLDSTLSTAPSSPIDGDSMLTPAASSFVTPCGSPQIHSHQPTKFFPTLFFGGPADLTSVAFPGGSSTFDHADMLYSTDSEEEEIDVESVCETSRVVASPPTANTVRAAPVRPAAAISSASSRKRRATTGPVVSPRKARRVSAAAAATMPTPSSSPVSPSAVDLSEMEDDLKKRSIHNILERKRREDLKLSFQLLRERVPDIAHDERAPKVVILKKATGHIHILKARQSDIQSEKEKLMHQQRVLQERLHQLH